LFLFFWYSCLMTDWLSWFSGSTAPTSGHSARCPYCMRVFVNNTNLKIHIRDVHSVDKGPFMCNECGKIVKNRGSLRVHTYRIHTLRAWKLLSQTRIVHCNSVTWVLHDSVKVCDNGWFIILILCWTLW
jgi:hypothetical protein